MPTVSDYEVLKTVTLTATREVLHIRYRAGETRIRKRVRLDDALAASAERRGAELQHTLYQEGGAIPKIHRVEEEDGWLVIEMAYCPGRSLQSLIGRITAELATRIVLALLGEVERWGRVVHGDIKPAHILWTDDGRLGVLDFGIAKGLADSSIDTRNPFRSLVYASPERLKTGRVDERADRWGIAISLYEAITGSVPFPAVDGRVRFRSTLPQSSRLPWALRRVLSKALDLDPARRYASPREFRRALEHSMAGGDGATFDQPTEVDSSSPGEVTQLDPEQAAAPASAPAHKAARQGWLDGLGVVRVRIDPRAFWWLVLLLAVLTALLVLNQIMLRNSADRLLEGLEKRSTTGLAAAQKLGGLRLRNLVPSALDELRAKVDQRLVETAMAPIVEFRRDLPATGPDGWSQAEAAVNQLIEMRSSRLPEASRLLVEGHLARLKRQWTEAEAKFRRAAEMDPASADPYLGLAVIYAYRKMNRTLLEQAIAAAAGRGHAAGKRETAQMADVWEWEAGHIRVPVQDGRRTALQLKRDYTQKAIELYRRIPGFAKADKALQRSLRSVRELDAQLRGGKR